MIITLMLFALTNQAQSNIIVNQNGSKIVILITVDGLKNDALLDPNLPSLPTIEWLMDNGATAEKMIIPNPTLTATGHVSLSTGADAATHGIMGNTFYDWKDNQSYSFFANPDDPYRNTTTGAHLMQVPQIFHLAEDNGMKTMALNWPYTEGTYKGTGITVNLPQDVSGGWGDELRAKKILEGLDDNPQIRLIFSRFHGVDSPSHNNGIQSDPFYDKLIEDDRALNRLISGLVERNLWDQTTLIIVSDHGMADVTNSNFFLKKSDEYTQAVSKTGLIPIIADDAAFSYLYFPKTDNTAKIELFADILEQNSFIDQTFVNEENEQIGLYNKNRGMNISVWDKIGITRNFGSNFLGMHGWLNNNSEMDASFLIMGSGVDQSAALGTLDAKDITPTILDYMGLPPMVTAQGVSFKDTIFGDFDNVDPSNIVSVPETSSTRKTPFNLFGFFVLVPLYVVIKRKISNKLV